MLQEREAGGREILPVYYIYARGYIIILIVGPRIEGNLLDPSSSYAFLPEVVLLLDSNVGRLALHMTSSSALCSLLQAVQRAALTVYINLISNINDIIILQAMPVLSGQVNGKRPRGI